MIFTMVLSLFITLMAALALRIRAKIQSPSPVAFQCIPSKLCPVIYDQVAEDIEKIEEARKPAARRLRRQALRQDFRLNWLYMCQEANNTGWFLRALIFESLRIPKMKSGMEYDDQEVLVWQLIREATALRWKLVRGQLALLIRFLVTGTVNTPILKALLNEYKSLEEQIDNLAGMKDLELQRKLREALGLNSWGILNGGNSEPA